MSLPSSNINLVSDPDVYITLFNIEKILNPQGFYIEVIYWNAGDGNIILNPNNLITDDKFYGGYFKLAIWGLAFIVSNTFLLQ